MDLYQLLHLPLYPFDILYNEDSSVTDSRIRRKPRDVIFWVNFEDDLISFIESNKEQLIDTVEFRPYPCPIDDKHQFVDEGSVQGILDNTVLIMLRKIFSTIKITGVGAYGVRNIYLESNCIGISGEPDRIIHRYSESKKKDRLILPIEIKKPLKDDEDLRKEYNSSAENSRSKKIIEQAVGYLYENNKNYGVITSYEHTYGLYLNNEGILHMTRGVLYNETKITALSAIWYLIHLSKNNREKFSCPKLDEISENKKRKIDRSSNSPSSEDMPGLIKTPNVNQTTQIKSGGRSNKSKSVCSGKFNNKNVIIKKALLGTSECNKIIHESNIYTHLYTLQGISIPRVILCGRDHKWFYLIIERRGVTIDCKDINTNIIACIDKTINLLHNLKVLHGDLELRNILLWRKKIFLIDFEESIVNCKKSEYIKEKGYFINKLKSIT